LVRRTHQTLKRVTNDFEVRWHFNTSVALIMELFNEFQAQEPLEAGASPVIVKRALMTLVLMLSPMVPHVAEELWEMLGIPGGIARQKWPVYREDLTREDQIEIIVQINGRVRGKILIDDSMTEDETRERSLADPRIKALLEGKAVVKVIAVPKKLVNIVLK
jgi:leucyl-tRNA synthetase